MNRNIGNRGQTNLLWYIIYLGAAVLILGTITFIGVNTFSVHSETDQLQREFIYEQVLDVIFGQDPYTGQHTQLATNTDERLKNLHQDDGSFAMRIKVDNDNHYSDEATFNTLLARIGTSSEIRVKKYNVDDKDIEITVVMEQ